MIRKDSLTEPNTSNMLSNTNINTELSNYSSTKKKSLKTTLYRIFTQRKKSNFNNSYNDIILIKNSINFFLKVQKFRTLQKNNTQFPNGEYTDQNQLTIKTESDKKVKKK